MARIGAACPPNRRFGVRTARQVTQFAIFVEYRHKSYLVFPSLLTRYKHSRIGIIADFECLPVASLRYVLRQGIYCGIRRRTIEFYVFRLSVGDSIAVQSERGYIVVYYPITVDQRFRLIAALSINP